MLKGKKKAAVERRSLLRIQAPGGRTWLVDLLGDSYLIGRGDPTGATKVDFQIPEDEYLSRAHCRVEKSDDGYDLENISPNGTLVNGVLLVKPVRLKGKEKIEIGEGTTLTYLVVTPDERRRLFEEQSGAKGKAREASGPEAPPKKPFYARPIFLAVVGFYGILALIILGVSGRKDTKVEDPGPGPYFAYLFDRPVGTQRPEGDAQGQADRMWASTLARHGGDLLQEDGHAYELIQAASEVAGVMGYATLRQALGKGEPFAQRAQLALDDLEEQVAALYAEAKAYLKARHWRLAYEAYARMAAAVPDSRAPVRRFAVDRMGQLRSRL